MISSIYLTCMLTFCILGDSFCYFKLTSISILKLYSIWLFLFFLFYIGPWWSCFKVYSMRDRFFGFCAQGTSVFMSFDFCMPWHLTSCSSHFFQHHCRNCGDIFCDKCTHGRIALTADANAQPVRVCDRCMVGVIDWLISLVLNLNFLFLFSWFPSACWSYHD